MSLRDQILSASDTGLHPVGPIPEWGGATVYVPIITLEDQAAVKAASEAEDKTVAAALFAIRDEQGRRVFSDADGPALRRKSLAVITRIIGVFNNVNGFGENPLPNSPTTPTSGSN